MSYLQFEGIKRLLSSDHLYLFEAMIHEVLKKHLNIGFGRVVYDDTSGDAIMIDSQYYSTPTQIIKSFLSFKNFNSTNVSKIINSHNMIIEVGKRTLDEKAKGKITATRSSQSKEKNLILNYHVSGTYTDVKAFLDEVATTEIKNDKEET